MDFLFNFLTAYCLYGTGDRPFNFCPIFDLTELVALCQMLRFYHFVLCQIVRVWKILRPGINLIYLVKFIDR